MRIVSNIDKTETQVGMLDRGTVFSCMSSTYVSGFTKDGTVQCTRLTDGIIVEFTLKHSVKAYLDATLTLNQ